MKDGWQIVDSGLLFPAEIMAKDTELLNQLNEKSPYILHLYEWKVDCLTYGYFTKIEEYLNLESLKLCGLEKARRPTGGGIIFHLSDLAFSILIPAHHPQFSTNTLENYAFINHKIGKIIDRFTSHSNTHLLPREVDCFRKSCKAFCMAKSTQFDLTIDGKKVGGAAQRRTKKGFLHQGSISLLLPPMDLLNQIIREKESVLKAMRENTYCLLPEESTKQDILRARQELRTLFLEFLN